MNTIKTDSDAWWFFITSLTELERQNGKPGTFPMKPINEYEIKFSFDGIDMPFEEVIEDWHTRMEQEVERKAAQRALEICTVANLNSLRELMEDFKYKVADKIKEVTGIEVDVNSY